MEDIILKMLIQWPGYVMAGWLVLEILKIWKDDRSKQQAYVDVLIKLATEGKKNVT